MLDTDNVKGSIIKLRQYFEYVASEDTAYDKTYDPNKGTLHNH